METDETQYGTITYLRIPPDLRKEIDALAKAESRLISQQLLVLIRKGLKFEAIEKKARRVKTEELTPATR